MLFNRAKTDLVTPERALRGRDHYEFTIPATHYVSGTPLQPPFPDGMATVVFGLGCFWGAEEIFWQTPGVYTTAVGYAGGYTSHPSYEEVCTGLTGHTEAVLVVYDPAMVSFERLVAIFFEVHDPTQGNRQGNDVGSQYRSAVYYTDESQREISEKAKTIYSAVIAPRGYPKATTEIAPLGDFFYAEGHHQQYLAKNPNGYRCHAATDIPFPADALG